MADTKNNKMDIEKHRPSPTLTTSESGIDSQIKKPETHKPVSGSYNSYVQRRADKAAQAQDAMYKVFDAFGKDATDEQLAAAAGDNLFAYQAQNGLKRGAWGTALGSGFLGKFDTDTRKAAYDAWEQQHNAAEQAKKATARKVNPMMVWSDTYRDGFGDNNEEALNKFYANTGIDNTQFDDALKAQLATAKTPQEVAMILANADDAYGDKLEEMGVQFSDNGIVMPHQRTYEEVLADKEREREAINYRTQQAEIAKQRARLGLADLSAGIGNMIKGAGGVNVTPQNYQQMYDNLTAQQKQNYNMYVARMDAIRKREEDRAKELKAYRDRDNEWEIRRQMQADQLAHDTNERKLDREAKASQEEASNKNRLQIAREGNASKESIADDNNSTKRYIAELTAQYKYDKLKQANQLNRNGKYAVNYGGRTWTFGREDNAKGAIDQVKSIVQRELKNNSKIKDDAELVKNINLMLMSIGVDSNDTYNQQMSNLNNALFMIEDKLSNDAIKDIEGYLKTYSSNQGKGIQEQEETTQSVQQGDSVKTLVSGEMGRGNNNHQLVGWGKILENENN